MSAAGDDARLVRELLRWYDRARRDLPWRSDRPDPYHVLVSEAMLQQTQVATVIPYYHRFLAAFPTIGDLAKADEQAVLRLWQGLGYYSRARNLHRAARTINGELGGVFPDTAAELRQLPGVGRYTAGAVASIAFGRAEPLVDGNVQRVLCRLDAISDDPRNKAVAERLWQRAGGLVPSDRPGDFNSALMELGATVCTPRNPQCLVCPWRGMCQAQLRGLEQEIPLRRKAKATPLEKRQAWVIVTADRRVLIEHRPARGRWAGLWQFLTLAMDASDPLLARLSSPRPLGLVRHALTHRRYEFAAFIVEADSALEAMPPRRWVGVDELAGYPMSKPQLDIARRAGLLPDAQ